MSGASDAHIQHLRKIAHLVTPLNERVKKCAPAPKRAGGRGRIRVVYSLTWTVNSSEAELPGKIEPWSLDALVAVIVAVLPAGNTVSGHAPAQLVIAVYAGAASEMTTLSAAAAPVFSASIL